MLVAVLLSLILLAAQQRERSVYSLRSGLSLIIYPVQYLVSLPASLYSRVADSVFLYDSLMKENKKLKHEELLNKAKLLKLAALEKENIRLRSLLESSYNLGEQVLIAELLSVNLAPYEHVVLVNKGSLFGIQPKQPVIDAEGIVGQVIRTNPLTSEIMLITDPSHAIAVQVNRNGLRTIAVGSGHLNRLNLPFLPNNVDIQPGDLLITSGLGGTFPQGYPVAVVDEVTPQPDKPFAKIQATPKALLDRSRELLIVWSNAEPVPLSVTPEPETEPIESNHASE